MVIFFFIFFTFTISISAENGLQVEDGFQAAFICINLQSLVVWLVPSVPSLKLCSLQIKYLSGVLCKYTGRA